MFGVGFGDSRMSKPPTAFSPLGGDDGKPRNGKRDAHGKPAWFIEDAPIFRPVPFTRVLGLGRASANAVLGFVHLIKRQAHGIPTRIALVQTFCLFEVPKSNPHVPDTIGAQRYMRVRAYIQCVSGFFFSLLSAGQKTTKQGF